MVNSQNRSIVTAAEFAELVGVKLATIRRWVREGRIPAVILPNGSPLFDLAEVKQALRDREQNESVTHGAIQLSEGGR